MLQHLVHVARLAICVGYFFHLHFALGRLQVPSYWNLFIHLQGSKLENSQVETGCTEVLFLLSHGREHPSETFFRTNLETWRWRLIEYFSDIAA
jgi:hypothetical protein